MNHTFRRTFGLLAMMVFAGGVALPASAGLRTAVLPFELIDDSQEGEADGIRADQTARLKLITAELIQKLKDDGRYDPIDLTAFAAEIEKMAPIHKCNGCDDDLGKLTGADVVMIGTVQKVSNLILNINLYVRDVKQGKVLKTISVDLRGNTDESWVRSMRYLIKNRLLVIEDAKP